MTHFHTFVKIVIKEINRRLLSIEHCYYVITKVTDLMNQLCLIMKRSNCQKQLEKKFKKYLPTMQ